MFKLLLKNNELESIYILSCAIYNAANSVTEIEDNILSGKKTIKSNLTFLNNLFTSLNYDDLSIIISKGVVKLDNFDSKKHGSLLLEVTRYCLHSSPSYRVFFNLLTNPTIMKDDLLENTHISDSYLNKIMKQIAAFFNESDLNIYSGKKAYVFEGPIVNWLYIFFFTSHVFTIVSDKHPEDDCLPLYGSDELKHNILVRVLQQPFADDDKRFFEDVDLMEMLDILIMSNDVLHKMDPTINLSKNKERLYALYIRLASSSFDAPTEYKRFTQLLLAHAEKSNPNPIIKETVDISKEFIKHISAEVTVNDDQFYETIYIIAIYQLKYRVLGRPIDRLFKFSPPFILNSRFTAEESLANLEIINESLKKDMRLSKESTNMLRHYHDSLFNDFHDIFDIKDSQPLKVYIKISYKITQTFYLKHKIQTVFSDQVITFTDKAYHADLIISDSYISSEKAIFYYMLNSNSPENIENLMHYILKLVIK